MTGYLMRGAIVIAALAVWFWTQKLIARKSGSKTLVGDAVHDLTEKWHRRLAGDGKLADFTLAASSLCIDVMGLAMIALSVFGGTFAPFLGILILFAMRQISQLCCTLPPPPGIIWRDPGFPSALVTYEVGNDFFFSGHTALAVLGAIHLSQNAPWWIGVLAVVVAFGEAVVVLVLRAHYTMDVIAGALAACLAAWLAGRMAPHVDGWLRVM